MSLVEERCPACSAPLPTLQPHAQRLQCPYCGSGLRVARRGDNLAVELAERVLSTVQESGAQTQAEFRRLHLIQELTIAEMHLANVHSEMRAIQRATITPVSRQHLDELHARSVTLQQQIASLKAQLYPSASPPAAPGPAKQAWRFSPQQIGWLLFSLQGRTNRTEFWGGMVVVIGLYCALMIVSAIRNAIPDGDGVLANLGTTIFSFVALIQLILLIWVGIAVGAKRFHDRDKSGWWVAISLIPVMGIFWFLIEAGILPGTPGPNRYG